jgi:hypothetical protein
VPNQDWGAWPADEVFGRGDRDRAVHTSGFSFGIAADGRLHELACPCLESGDQDPDFSCISKRSTGLPRHALSKALEPGSVVIVDSTGLKVYGRDEWHQEKHDVAARRTWRKLHLAIDEHHQILACELTTPEVGDTTAVPDLLGQITTPFDSFMGDRALTSSYGLPVPKEQAHCKDSRHRSEWVSVLIG